jgi:protein-disulfide isomerase-like protein with CxxC motif
MLLSDPPKARLSATSPACRAIVATRLVAPGLEDAALRALQFAQFTTTGALDDPDTLRSALAAVEGLDADTVAVTSDEHDVEEISGESWPGGADLAPDSLYERVRTGARPDQDVAA